MHTVLVDYNGVAYTCGHGAALGLGEQLTATEVRPSQQPTPSLPLFAYHYVLPNLNDSSQNCC